MENNIQGPGAIVWMETGSCLLDEQCPPLLERVCRAGTWGSQKQTFLIWKDSMSHNTNECKLHWQCKPFANSKGRGAHAHIKDALEYIVRWRVWDCKCVHATNNAQQQRSRHMWPYMHAAKPNPALHKGLQSSRATLMLRTRENEMHR